MNVWCVYFSVYPIAHVSKNANFMKIRGLSICSSVSVGSAQSLSPISLLFSFLSTQRILPRFKLVTYGSSHERLTRLARWQNKQHRPSRLPPLCLYITNKSTSCSLQHHILSLLPYSFLIHTMVSPALELVHNFTCL